MNIFLCVIYSHSEHIKSNEDKSHIEIKISKKLLKSSQKKEEVLQSTFSDWFNLHYEKDENNNRKRLQLLNSVNYTSSLA